MLKKQIVSAMKLEDIWNSFTDRMAEIELYHRAAKNTAKKELQLINEQAEYLNEHPDFKDCSSSLHNMTFYEARDGMTRIYNFKERTIEDRHLDVILHKNKQYQWLLAEAYEEFEDFIEKLYAYYGKHNSSFWPLKDFGNITLTELPDKTYDWYLEQAKKKKGTPQRIINRFRKYFNNLGEIEINNKFDINLSLTISLIEKLRHIIVHKGGKVSSVDSFIKITAESCGLYSNGNISEQNKGFIKNFFGSGKHSNLIALLEIRILPHMPIDIHVSRFQQLTGYLLAYSFLLVSFVDGAIKEKNA